MLITRCLCLQQSKLAAVTGPPGQDSVGPPKPRLRVHCREGEDYKAKIENRQLYFVSGRPLETFKGSVFIVVSRMDDRL